MSVQLEGRSPGSFSSPEFSYLPKVNGGIGIPTCGVLLLFELC